MEAGPKSVERAEETRARKCWGENSKFIAEYNKAHGGKSKLGENKFTDQCWEDFKNQRTMQDMPNGICYKSPIPLYDKPVDTSAEVDWRTKGYVTPVKDQGQCGSCWSFSATGCMEGAWYKTNKKLVAFSEQELVACDTGGSDNGCSGGGPDTAFQWVIGNGGISTESDYPYTAGSGKAGSCDSSKTKTKAGTFGSFTYLDRNNETKVLAALQNEGPISVLVQATQAWQSYHGGMITQSSCGVSGTSSIDHAVLAVGYGTDSSNGNYWIIKNSWGSSWGEDGYIRLQFNENACNIAACFSYFVSTGKAPPAPPGPPGPAPGPAPPMPVNCGSAFDKNSCAALKAQGCHWCPVFSAGFCFPQNQKCPPTQ